MPSRYFRYRRYRWYPLPVIDVILIPVRVHYLITSLSSWRLRLSYVPELNWHVYSLSRPNETHYRQIRIQGRCLATSVEIDILAFPRRWRRIELALRDHQEIIPTIDMTSVVGSSSIGIGTRPFTLTRARRPKWHPNAEERREGCLNTQIREYTLIYSPATCSFRSAS
jgi:hypothetical protein